MPVRYFLAPYKFRPDAIHPWRYCALDDFTRDVLAEGGDWRESEIEGNRAIVRVRAGAATLARIGRGSDVPIARLDNPASVWTPYRTAPINRGGEIAFDSGRRSPTLPLAEIIRAVRDDRAQEEHVQRVRKPGSIIGYTRRGLPVFQMAGMAFPTQGVIDNFNRASLGGNWTTLLGTLAISGSTVLSCSGTPGIGEYNVSTYGAGSECYATVPTVPADGQYVSVLARMTTLSIASTDGYMVRVYKYATTDEWQIHRIDNASATQLGATISQEWAAGDSIGIEVSGSTITAYFKTGGSWSSPGNRSDATYGSAGYLGVIFGDTTARLDDFGGGTISTGSSISGTINGTASQSGSLTGTGALSGTIPGVASQTATLRILVPISGTAAGVASQTGALVCAIAGTAAGSAGQSGALTGTGALAGTVAGIASQTGSLVCALAGATSGVASHAATLIGTGALSGVAPGTGAASGSLVCAIAGSTAGLAAQTGSLTGTGALNGTVSGTSSYAADLTAVGSGAISGTASGTAGQSATLTGTGALNGVIPGVGAATGTLTGIGAGTLIGTIQGTSTALAVIGGRGALSATNANSGGASGTLGGSGALVSTVAGTSSQTGTLAGYGALNATAIGQAIVLAALLGYGALAGESDGTSTAVLTYTAPATGPGTRDIIQATARSTIKAARSAISTRGRHSTKSQG